MCLFCSMCWISTQDAPLFPGLTLQKQQSPCVRRWSGYKYELRFALFSDEWSCRSVGTSFQSLSLPLIPRPRPEGSCENWKWQSNQHVEQADWTKLSWPRSELFNTGPIGGLCDRGCSRSVWEPETQRGERQRSSGKQGEERESAWSKVHIKLCGFAPKSLISVPPPLHHQPPTSVVVGLEMFASPVI